MAYVNDFASAPVIRGVRARPVADERPNLNRASGLLLCASILSAVCGCPSSVVPGGFLDDDSDSGQIAREEAL